MKICKYSFLIVFLAIIGPSCGQRNNTQSAVKVYYLFDISGSFQQPNNGITPLEESVNIAKRIVNELSSLTHPKYFPQEYQIGFISEGREPTTPPIKFEIDCIFCAKDYNNEAKKKIKSELDKVLQTPSSGSTDISAGFYKATQAFMGSSSNKIIIAFSDFKNDTGNPPNKVNMSGIKFLGYYTDTETISIPEQELIKDEIKTFLEESDCYCGQDSTLQTMLNTDSFRESQIIQILEYDEEKQQKKESSPEFAEE